MSVNKDAKSPSCGRMLSEILDVETKEEDSGN